MTKDAFELLPEARRLARIEQVTARLEKARSDLAKHPGDMKLKQDAAYLENQLRDLKQAHAKGSR